MKREEFLARLEQGLVGLGEEERAEALKFYNEYLDEVGPGQEEQEIARMGDPRRVRHPVPPGRSPGFHRRVCPGSRASRGRSRIWVA